MILLSRLPGGHSKSAGPARLETVTVVEFRVGNKGSDGTGCFRMKVRTDTAKRTNMRIAGLRKC